MTRKPSRKRPSGPRRPGAAPRRAVPPGPDRTARGADGTQPRSIILPVSIPFPLALPSPAKAVAGTSRPRPAVVHPGPSPLPPPQPMPTLARVGGAAGTTSALEFVGISLAVVSELRPHALGVTYWFDPPATGGPYDVLISLTGRRLDLTEARTPDDDFVTHATLADVRAGSGRTSLTHRVLGKAPGRWHVTAQAVAVPRGADRSGGVQLPPAEGVGSSTFAPVASMRAPGVVLGAWPAMVGLGVVLAFLLQGVLAGAHGMPSGKVLVLALSASFLGALGAKLYFWLTHRMESSLISVAGMSVQGFVIVATATFVIGGLLGGINVGHLLDLTVPALLLGQAVGRLGCLLGGCCAGLPTHSRWAVWSSDRRVGTRRIPVQLLESGAAGLLALAAALIEWNVQSPWPGLLFVGGLAAYVVVRQLLFPLRGVPRATRHGRQVTLAVALVALLAALLVPLVG